MGMKRKHFPGAEEEEVEVGVVEAEEKVIEIREKKEGVRLSQFHYLTT